MRKIAEFLCRLLASVIVIPVVLLSSSASYAAVWNEIFDAGDLPQIAQETDGIGELSTINGYIAGLDIDMYKIFVAASSGSLWASSSAPAGSNLRPQLFLFDENGFGITSSDGISTTIISASGLSGFYYLAISPFDIDPFGDNLRIFAMHGGGGPTGPGGDNSVGGWGGTYSAVEDTYSVSLSGATFSTAAVPLPAAIWLFGSSVLLLLSFRKRTSHR